MFIHMHVIIEVICCLICLVLADLETFQMDSICPGGGIGSGDLIISWQARSRIYCWTQCAQRERCVAAMWTEGTTCSLYYMYMCSISVRNAVTVAKSSRCGVGMAPMVPGLTSHYYMSSVIDPSLNWYDAGDFCYNKRSHLIAVDSLAEHQLFKTLLQSNTGGCQFAWTAGWSPVAGSTDINDWSWNVTSANLPVTNTY